MMSDIEANGSGFDALEKMLQEFAKKADDNRVLQTMEKGAQAFVEDLLKLPKPKSVVTKSGYTHLIDTFTYRRNKGEIEVGWGKYYGPMVERGTKRMSAHPHLSTLWNQNKEKYYKKMLDKF